MASTITPNTFTSSVVIAAQALLQGNRISAQLDLRGKFGAMLNAAIARISTTAYVSVAGASGGIDLIINRQFATLAGSPTYSTVGGNSAYNIGRSGSLAASGSVTRLVSTQNALGDTQIITKTSDTGSTGYGSLLAFLGQVAAPASLTNATLLPTFEIARMSSSSGSGPWTKQLAQPLGIVHPVGDYITDAPDVWDIWLPGGFVYNVMFDANSISAGVGAAVQAVANVYPSDNAT